MKLDLFKSVILILLIALVYFMFKLSKTIESNAVEYAKTGRFINMGDYVILDTQTGATYDISTEGSAPIRTPVIAKWFLYIYTTAKEVEKKAPKEPSNIFLSIMAASVKDNPKPAKKAKKKA